MNRFHCDNCDKVITDVVPRMPITIGDGYNLIGDFEVFKDSAKKILCRSCTIEAIKVFLVQVESTIP